MEEVSMKKNIYLWLVVAALFCLLGLTEYSNAQRSNSMKQTWEYQIAIVQDDPNKLVAQINKLGAEGWELVAVSTTSRDFNVAYLKRPK
jgi:hypothetical protein